MTGFVLNVGSGHSSNNKADVDEAVNVARRAFEEGKWPNIGPHQRARYLLKIADLIA
jgi:phenylacetaldehyde dehydrogenase